MPELPEMLPWWAVLVAAVVGLIIGYLLPRAGKGKAADQAEQVAKLQQELQDYRGQVQGHFQQTASLVTRLTHDYKAVYDHLASGVDELCGDAAEGNDNMRWPRPYTPLSHASEQPSGEVEAPDPASYPPDYTTANSKTA